MNKVLIIFGSTTGNTERMAEIIKGQLEETAKEIEVKNVTQASVEDLTADYDLVLLGCAAYGFDSIELQEDFQEFYEKINNIQLNGKPYAVFAPGDSSYEFFCGSVDMLQEKMDEIGGKMVVDALRIDGDPEDFENDIAGWVKSITGAF
jgi:flavodoxin short chain